MEIKTFGNKETENFVKTGKLEKGCKWRNLVNVAQRKMDMVVFADSIDDLRIPPSNRLEKLSHDLSGFWSIRINDQFRVVFQCENSMVYEIKTIDYH